MDDTTGGGFMKRKVWRWVRIGYGILFILAVVTVISALAIIMTAILADKAALVNTALMNSVALIMALISLPGILVQLISLMFTREKKYIITTKCPNCKHLVDFRMKEE